MERAWDSLLRLMGGAWANAVWLVGVSLVATLAILALRPTVAPKSYPVIDSGAYVSRAGVRQVGWLNNEEVMFFSADDRLLPPGDRLPLNAIYIWKVGEGIRLYRNNVASMTIGNERISYCMKPDQHGDSKCFWGVPGSEREMDLRELDPMTMQPAKTSDTVHGINRRPLLPGHGELVINWNERFGPAKFYAEGDDKGIDMPFTSGMFDQVRYIPLKKAYLIERNRGDLVGNGGVMPPKGTPRAAWWLKPDGSLTEFNLPKGWEDEEFFFPVKNGWLVQGYDGRLDRVFFPRDTGLYLIEPDGQVTTLIQPMPTQLAVSPDGCRAAFTYTHDIVGSNLNTLKVISLC